MSKHLFSTGRIFSLKANFFESRHAQFDAYRREIFAGSFSLCKKIELEQLLFVSLPKKFASHDKIRLRQNSYNLFLFFYAYNLFFEQVETLEISFRINRA